MSAHGIAIVGCGDMGGAHANAWLERNDATVVAVADEDADRAATMAEKTAATACADWREAIAADGVTVVSVCVPVCFHAEITIAAAELGKHVLCEKPMALTVAEADAMIAAADAAGTRLGISYQFRGRGPCRAIKGAVDEGLLGSPLHFRFVDLREVRPKLAMHSRAMNGGPVHDMAGHFVDLVRWITGAEVIEVSAGGGVFGAGKERLATVEDLGVDTAEILLRLEGGHVGSINVGWGLPEGTPTLSRCAVAGPLGYLTQEDAVVSISDPQGRRSLAVDPDPTGPAVRIADLLDAIAKDTVPEVDGRAGRAALAATLAAIKSTETGKSVVPD